MQLSTTLDSVDKCFEVAKANNFCGKMIVMNKGNCYCRGVGKEDSCTRIPVASWKVYTEKTGKLEHYTNIEEC